MDQLQLPNVHIAEAITLTQTRPMPILTIPAIGPLAMAKPWATMALPTSLFSTAWTIR